VQSFSHTANVLQGEVCPGKAELGRIHLFSVIEGKALSHRDSEVFSHSEKRHLTIVKSRIAPLHESFACMAELMEDTIEPVVWTSSHARNGQLKQSAHQACLTLFAHSLTGLWIAQHQR